MGALESVDGSREDVAIAARATAETVFYASHNWQLFFIEGTKTAFEIWEQLGFSVPDNVIVPLGYGSNVIGLHIGFGVAGGGSDRPRRRYSGRRLQIARRFTRRGVRAVSVPRLKQSLPSRTALQASGRCDYGGNGSGGETGGAIVAVEEDEIVESFHGLALRGFFVEPGDVRQPARFCVAFGRGAVKEDETSVLVLTGHGLKAADKITSFIAP